MRTLVTTKRVDVVRIEAGTCHIPIYAPVRGVGLAIDRCLCISSDSRRILNLIEMIYI